MGPGHGALGTGSGARPSDSTDRPVSKSHRTAAVKSPPAIRRAGRPFSRGLSAARVTSWEEKSPPTPTVVGQPDRAPGLRVAADLSAAAHRAYESPTAAETALATYRARCKSGLNRAALERPSSCAKLNAISVPTLNRQDRASALKHFSLLALMMQEPRCGQACAVRLIVQKLSSR